MAERLPRITAAEALRALERDGWVIVRQSGTSHAILRHPSKPGRLTLALHRRRIMKLKTLQTVLEDAGLTAEELRRLL